ncbi:MAG: hypothetical protein KDD78_01180 [Caldilineaceae bacterium]|nr:hypothetical protein [Caldilineaceae bacterium]
MNQTNSFPIKTWLAPTTWPLWRLLHPRSHAWAAVISFSVGLIVSMALIRIWSLPLWVSTAVVLLALLPVGIRKWHEDRQLWGSTVMWLSILLTVQGVHTIEHFAQWTQYHIFYWTMRESNGLLSPANAEWVHFVWNWAVLIVVVVLMRGGMRNGWAWLLLAVAVFHTAEHSYTFIRYQLIFGELRRLGLIEITPQGLAGIVGRDGWLARNEWTRGSILCSVPGLTTAIRLDIHFWWNALEMGCLMLAGHIYLRRLPAFSDVGNASDRDSI